MIALEAYKKEHAEQVFQKLKHEVADAVKADLKEGVPLEAIEQIKSEEKTSQVVRSVHDACKSVGLKDTASRVGFRISAAFAMAAAWFARRHRALEHERTVAQMRAAAKQEATEWMDRNEAILAGGAREEEPAAYPRRASLGSTTSSGGEEFESARRHPAWVVADRMAEEFFENR
ncbi:hypothetical protein MMC13_008017 [Lambiella insularis]|nr:hypothetical protein [Lambiella insularis]